MSTAEKIIQLFPQTSPPTDPKPAKPKKPAAAKPSYGHSGSARKRKHFRYTDAHGVSREHTVYGATAAEAEKKKRDFLADVEKSLRMDQRARSVGSWADEWLEVYKRPEVTLRTFETYARDIRLIKDAIGNFPLRSVTPVDLKAIVAGRAGLSSSAIKKTAMTIRALFAAAVENRIIHASPAVGLKPIKGTVGSHEDLSDDEILAIMEAMNTGHRFALAAGLMLFAGLRKAESAAFRLDRDYVDGMVHVRESVTWPSNQAIICPPKSEAGFRSIPVFSPLAPHLDGAAGKQNIIPWSKTGPISERGFNYAHQSFVELCGVDFRPGDLRTTFATLLYDAEVDVKTAQLWLGHADPAVTIRFYIKLSKRRQRRTPAQAAAFFDRFSSTGDNSGDNAKPNQQESIDISGVLTSRLK